MARQTIGIGRVLGRIGSMADALRQAGSQRGLGEIGLPAPTMEADFIPPAALAKSKRDR